MENLTLPSPLVSAKWLKENHHHPQLIILDASAHMPGSDRDAMAEWKNKHIKGARFFDFNNAIADTLSSLPHMLPTPEIFTQEAQALGINQDSIIVIYDSLGIFSAPRAWWMFMAMGHTQCAVLDGGLPEWEKQKNATHRAEKTAIFNTGNFVAQYQSDWIKDKNQILHASQSHSATIIDARSQARFDGHAKEPREGLISGHIPHSINLPFTELLENGLFKPTTELRERINQCYDNKGGNNKSDEANQPLYATCGSGITACIIAFAAHLAGIKKIAVYDGSWCEWGDPNNHLPIDTTTD
ncbi:3-mercaptopyruvate sulfurtransferase [Eionea flava]